MAEVQVFAVLKQALSLSVFLPFGGELSLRCVDERALGFKAAARMLSAIAPGMIPAMFRASPAVNFDLRDFAVEYV